MNEAVADQCRTMACTFYYSSCVDTFKKYDEVVIRKLAEEIGGLSFALPLFYRPDEYKIGEVMKALENISVYSEIKKSEYLSAFPDNHVSITINGEVVKDRVTLLYLVALLGYCVDRLSKGQLSQRLEFVRMGKLIAQE